MSLKFELLKEFSSFCHDNGIRCYLQGSLLRAAFEGEPFNPEWDRITVAVTGKGFLKLNRLMSTESFADEHPNRVLESLMTNDHFPGLYAKYVATDTLHIDFRDEPEWFANKGLAVTIMILVNHPNRLERVPVLGMYTSENPVLKKLVQLSGRFRRKVFQTYLNQWNSLSEGSGFYSPEGRVISFSKGFWKYPVKKSIDGFSFFCPRRFNRQQQRRPYYTLDSIHSECMTYDEFCALCSQRGISLQEIYADRHQHLDEYSEEIISVRKNKRYYNAAFYSTMIRKNTSEAIAACPVRDLNDADYKEIIEQYLGQLLTQSKNGITPYISHDVYIDAMKLYVQQNSDYFNTRRVVMKKLLKRHIERIPDRFLLYSPVVAQVCYSEKDASQDTRILRESLTKEVLRLLK